MLYKENYYNEENTGEAEYREAEHNRNKELYALTIRQIKQHIKNNKSILEADHLKILDFGSGPGAFLSECKNSGFDTTGIEFSKVASEYARKTYGLNIIQGTEISLSELPSDHYNIVTCWNVIEHLTNASPILTEFYRILKPGGLLCVSTPNIDCYEHKIKKGNWYTVANQAHMIFFNKASLKKLLFTTGFKNVRRIYFWGGQIHMNFIRRLIQYLTRFIGINHELRIYSEK